MAAFKKTKILVISSRQPANQYAGGGTGINDSELFWMTKLADEIVAQLKTTGHDIRRGPATIDPAATHRQNVTWAQKAENSDAALMISCHSNASRTPGTKATGIGIYTHPNSPKGKAFATSLQPFLKPVSATGKCYLGTLTVAEIASTKPPCLLVEHEFHDWVGSTTAGGADWIRHAPNRTALAKAYRKWIVSMWGEQNSGTTTTTTTKAPTTTTTTTQKPTTNTDRTYRFLQANIQAERWGGLSDKSDLPGKAIKADNARPSVMALCEVTETRRNAIRAVLDAARYRTYPYKYVCVMWDSWKWQHSTTTKKVSFGTNYHGAIRVELTDLTASKAGAMDVISLHVRPTASTNEAGKRNDIKLTMDNLYRKGQPTIVAGDFNLKAEIVESIMKTYGLVRANPIRDTVDANGTQSYDNVFITPGLIKTRGYTLINPGIVSDHLWWLINGTLVNPKNRT